MRIDNPAFARINQGRHKRPFFVVEIEFAPGDSVYLTSHREALTPEEAVVLPGVIQGLSGTTQRIDPAKANSTIGNIGFEVVDKSGAFTELLRQKLGEDKGLRHKRVRFYQGFEGLDSFADYIRFQTQRVESAEHDGGSYKVSCFDIQRAMREEIFEPKRTALSAAISDADTVIPVYQAGAFEMVAHGPSYSDAPNQTVGYLKIGSGDAVEVVRYTGKDERGFVVDRRSSTLASATSANVRTVTVVDASAFRLSGAGTIGGEPFAWARKEGNALLDCSGVTAQPSGATVIDAVGRGVMGTRARAWELRGDKEDNGTKVEEYIYLELPAVKLIYALLTGSLYNQPGRRLPDHWQLGIPAEYVRLPDFVNIGSDWWSPTDDTRGQVVRFEGLGKEDGKRFIEEQVCLFLGAFMPVYSDGSLGLKRMTGVLSDAAYVDRLDETNIVSYGALKHDMRALQNRFLIEWNWRPGQDEYTRKNLLIDANSIRRHGEADLKRLSFKGLHGSRHSYSTLKNQFDALRDRNAGPPQRLSLRLLPSKNTLEVGDVVRVDLSQLRDPNSSSGLVQTTAGLDRAFEVQQVRVNWITGQVDVELFGSSEKAEPLPDEESGFVVPPGWYASEGTDLLAAFPEQVTQAGGVVTVTGAIDLSGGIYYALGDLTIAHDAVVTYNATTQLRVRGFLTVNGTLDGRGRGHPGGAGNSSGAIDQAGTLGTGGFIGGAITSQWGVRRSSLVLWEQYGATVSAAQGGNAACPPANVRVVGDRVVGIPEDLRGTSGPGGSPLLEGVAPSSVVVPGSAGGASGAGLAIVCRGMAFGANGRIDCSGTDSATPGYVLWGAHRVYAGAGGGGSPGAVYVFIDGDLSITPDLSRHVVADHGRSLHQGSPEVGDKWLVLRDPQHLSAARIGQPSPAVGLGSSAYLIWYIKADRPAEQDPPDTADAPLGVTLVEHTNTPKTPAGNQSTISIYAQPPSDPAYAYAHAYWRRKGSSTWARVPVAASPETLLTVESDGATYEIQLRAVSTSGEESPSGPVASITVSRIDDPYAIGAPVQLRAESGTAHLLMARDGTIVSRIYLTWNAVAHSSLAGYEVEHRLAGEAVWADRQTVTTPSAYVYAAKDGQAYELRVRAITSVARSDWVQTTHTVIGKTEPPANVTGFSAYQNGPSAVLRWRQVPDRDLAGYKLRFMGQNAPFSWDLADDLTDLVRGTEITTAGLAPGVWFVGIKAVDTSGNESPHATVTTVEIRNRNDAIYIRPQAPDWPGVLEGFEVVGGALQLAPDLPPDGRATYIAPYIDMAFADTVRAWAEIHASAPGATDPDPDLQLRFSLGLTDDEPMWVEGDDNEPMWAEGDDQEPMWQGWSEWKPWTVGEVHAELVQFRLVRDVAKGDLSVKAFTPILDVPPRSESARGIAVPAGGATILFSRPFHLPPVVQITTSGGALIPSVTNETTLGFDITLYALDGTPAAGTINWTASTE